MMQMFEDTHDMRDNVKINASSAIASILTDAVIDNDGNMLLPSNILEALLLPLFSADVDVQRASISGSSISLQTLSLVDTLLLNAPISMSADKCTLSVLRARIENVATMLADEDPRRVLSLASLSLNEDHPQNLADAVHSLTLRGLTWGHLADSNGNLSAAAWFLENAGPRRTSDSRRVGTPFATMFFEINELSPNVPITTPEELGETILGLAVSALQRPPATWSIHRKVKSAFALSRGPPASRQLEFEKSLGYVLHHFPHVHMLIGKAADSSKKELVSALMRIVPEVGPLTSTLSLSALDTALSSRMPRLQALGGVDNRSPSDNVLKLLTMEAEYATRLEAAPTATHISAGDHSGDQTGTAAFQLRSNQASLAVAIDGQTFQQISQQLLKVQQAFDDPHLSDSHKNTLPTILSLALTPPVHLLILQALSSTSMISQQSKALQLISRQRDSYQQYISNATIMDHNGGESYLLGFRLSLQVTNMLRLGKFSEINWVKDVVRVCNQAAKRRAFNAVSMEEILKEPAAFRAFKLFMTRLVSALGFQERGTINSLSNILTHVEETMDLCPDSCNIEVKIAEGLSALWENLQSRYATAKQMAPTEASQVITIAHRESAIWDILQTSKETIRTVNEIDNSVHFITPTKYLRLPQDTPRQRNRKRILESSDADAGQGTRFEAWSKDNLQNNNKKGKNGTQRKSSGEGEEVPFAETKEFSTRIHKSVYDNKRAAEMAGVNKDNHCWTVALSMKGDETARKNCKKPNCNDPPGVGRHQCLFMKKNLDPSKCLDTKKTQKFKEKFSSENLRFAQSFHWG